MIRLGFLLLLTVIAENLFSQSHKYEITFEGTEATQAIKEMESKYGLKFSYNPKLLEGVILNQTFRSNKEKRFLDEFVRSLPVDYKQAGEVILLIPAKKSKPPPKVQGKVYDNESGQPLAFAHISGLEAPKAVSNSSGNFSFIPARDSMKITVSYLGYKPSTLWVKPNLEEINIKLEPDTQVLPDFILNSYANYQSLDGITGTFSIDPGQISSLPSLGEPDIFKSLQLLPGISATDESSSGLVVRGNAPDQNLITLDGFTLYHVDHFFGLFSTFNPNTINKVDLYKGGFSARYGGRISSVIDATSKNGNLAKFKGGIGLNVTSLNGYFETPVGKKLSIVFGIRTSHSSLLESDIYNQFLSENRVDVLQAEEPDFGEEEIVLEPSFNFYDINSKVRFKPKKGTVIDFSLFLSEDDYAAEFEEDDDLSLFEYRDEAYWSNAGASINWNQEWSSKHISSFLLSASSYESTSYSIQENLYTESAFEDDEPDGEFEEDIAELFSDTIYVAQGQEKFNTINDLSLKWQSDFALNDQQRLLTGLDVTTLSTSYSLLDLEEEDDFAALIEDGALLSSAYGEYHFLSNKWGFNTGVRINHYSLLDRIDFEPRMSGRYFINEALSLNLTWSIHHQYVNRISVSPFGNSDQYYWVMSDDEDFPVLRGEHFIAGIKHQKGGWTFDIEAYHKRSTGILESEFALYSSFNGLSFDDLEGISLSGDNYSQGIDVFAKYRADQYTSWISYSIASSKNEFDILNNGERYASAYDQRHELNIVNQLKHKKWEFSSVFVYGSGAPYTPPGIVANDSEIFYDLDEINSLRLPSYHRLDLAVKYSTNFKPFKIETGLTLFNIYNRQNIKSRRFTSRFEFDEDSGEEKFQIVPVDIGLLGITPNLFLNIHF